MAMASCPLTRYVWHLSLVHRHNWTQCVCALQRLSIPDWPLHLSLSLSLNFIFILVHGPYEMVEVKEKLLVVALAAVVMLLVSRRPAEYTMG